MFTGLVEGIGKVISIEETNGGRLIDIEFSWLDKNLKLGESVSINGACQTITEICDSLKKFKVYSSFKTLELTNLGRLKNGDCVNLERSVTPSTRLGGHLVQGHVDGIGKIINLEIRDRGNAVIYHIDYPDWMDKYIVTRGSIAVDGISLTIVSQNLPNNFELVLIPETIQKTNAYTWNLGSIVNLEIDLIARYLEKLINKNT